jgi:hypothetical protein
MERQPPRLSSPAKMSMWEQPPSAVRRAKLDAFFATAKLHTVLEAQTFYNARCA